MPAVPAAEQGLGASESTAGPEAPSAVAQGLHFVILTEILP